MVHGKPTLQGRGLEENNDKNRQEREQRPENNISLQMQLDDMVSSN